MQPKIGDRVGALLSEHEGTASLLGYGVYMGDHIPDDFAVGLWAEEAREFQLANPKIVLDSGQTVWGCECWWGPEEQIKKSITGKKIVEVDIDKVRAKIYD
jgi:hypothetical protein